MDLLIVGDYFFDEKYWLKNTYRLNHSAFEAVSDIIKAADYSIVNYESVVAAATDRPIVKDGPHLRSPEEAIRLAKEIGFDCCTLANNHTLDYGPDALFNTIGMIESQGLDHVGAGANRSQAATVLYKEIKGVKLAVINCCEYEFSIATDCSAGTNHADPISIYYQIKQAAAAADYVIVINHGGPEHQQLPSPRMQKQFRFFIDAGANAVINHHQHCFSGYEKYNGGVIFYGLGNFFFPWEGRVNEIWNQGFMARLTIDHSGTTDIKLIPYIQTNGQARIELMETEAFEHRLQELNEIISDPKRLTALFDQWMKKTEETYLDAVIPLRGWNNSRRLKLFARLGLIPSLDYAKISVFFLNCLRCESHLDRMRASIYNYLLDRR